MRVPSKIQSSCDTQLSWPSWYGNLSKDVSVRKTSIITFLYVLISINYKQCCYDTALDPNSAFECMHQHACYVHTLPTNAINIDRRYHKTDNIFTLICIISITNRHSFHTKYRQMYGTAINFKNSSFFWESLI